MTFGLPSMTEIRKCTEGAELAMIGTGKLHDACHAIPCEDVALLAESNSEQSPLATWSPITSE